MSVTQYDDGPYFGSAVRLVHGVLPYRDYAFVQPPGITVLMSPAALESYLGGTAWGLVLGRILTVLAGTAAVVLAGLLVRHRGVLAVLLTGGIMAIYPPAAASARTVLLEPWLVLFCLAGARGRVRRRPADLPDPAAGLGRGGVRFRRARSRRGRSCRCSSSSCCACRELRRAAVFVAGVAAGFLDPILPFVIAAPRLLLRRRRGGPARQDRPRGSRPGTGFNSMIGMPTP